MERTAIQSHILTSIGYDPATKTLQVEFPRRQKEAARAVYNYHDVSQEQFDALMGKGKTAEEKHSISSHFLKYIKPNHKYTRIEETNEDQTQEDAPIPPAA